MATNSFLCFKQCSSCLSLKNKIPVIFFREFLFFIFGSFFPAHTHEVVLIQKYLLISKTVILYPYKITQKMN